METLAAWTEGQYRHAAKAMLASVSPLDVVKTRPGFGQVIRPRRGAIVASPVLADYDPEPDYFFHWYRDSALVADALRLLSPDATQPLQALSHFADFVDFSRSLRLLDGRTLIAASAWRARVQPAMRKFLRTDTDLAAAHDQAIAAETRVNADGTLDITRWPRPQHDGVALRALCVMRWARSTRLDADLDAACAALVDADLAYTRAHWREPCFDIWEEEQGLHYYTLCVAAAALEEGAQWLEGRADLPAAQACRTQARLIDTMLDGFWLAERGHYGSRILAAGAQSAKQLDIAVILAAIHASRSGDTHSVHDPRMHATLARLDELFDAQYPINRGRGAGLGPALGRYAGDVYFSGGPYYFSTLAAAEFCYRAAVRGGKSRALVERGDGYLATVRAFVPASGALSEQFDGSTGAQTSARELAWSYAAFISCIAARRQVIAGND
ncbi:MAG: glycoside hydrolase family 15 protein [Steroidobacterales bacterium]